MLFVALLFRLNLRIIALVACVYNSLFGFDSIPLLSMEYLLINLVNHAYKMEIIRQIKMSLSGTQLYLKIIIILVKLELKLVGVNQGFLDNFYIIIHFFEKKAFMIYEIVFRDQVVLNWDEAASVKLINFVINISIMNQLSLFTFQYKFLLPASLFLHKFKNLRLSIHINILGEIFIL